MRTIDYKSNIRFIIENFDHLRISGTELRTLQDTISFLKLQVQQQIVEQKVAEDVNLKQQIEETQAKLKEKIEQLKQRLEEEEKGQEFPEYKPIEKKDGVADSLYQEAESRKKAEYEVDKKIFNESTRPAILQRIKIYQKIVERLENLVLSLDEPEAFIKQIISTDNTKEYTYLMNLCARSMASGYDNMEKYGSDTLFTRNLAEDSTVFYTPKPKAIEGFLDLIRNPELLRELSEYNELRYSGTMYKQGRLLEDARAKEKSLLQLEEKLSSKSDECQSIEELITKIAQLIQQQEDAEKELLQLQLPIKKSAFSKFFDTLLGKTKRTNLRREKLSTSIDEYKKELEDIQKDDKNIKVINSPLYRQYIYTALAAYEGRADQDAPTPEQLLAEKDDMYLYVKEQTHNDLEVAQQNIEELQNFINQKKAEIAKKYSELSPQAKELADKGIRTDDLMSKYTERTKKSSTGRLSPFIASIILETLINDKNIGTIEELREFGVQITPEQITNYGKYIEEAMQKVQAKLQLYEKSIKSLEEDGR